MDLDSIFKMDLDLESILIFCGFEFSNGFEFGFGLGLGFDFFLGLDWILDQTSFMDLDLEFKFYMDNQIF